MQAKENLNRRVYGSIYEDKAREHLISLDYRFLAKNVTFKSGEIDLVFEQRVGNKIELVFVEVRKKSEGGWIVAEESITYPKQRTLKNAMKEFLLRYRGNASSMRLDLIAFQGESIRHFQNFMPYESY